MVWAVQESYIRSLMHSKVRSRTTTHPSTAAAASSKQQEAEPAVNGEGGLPIRVRAMLLPS